MVLYETDDIVLFRELDEIKMILKQLHGRLGDQNMDTMLDSGLCDGIMGICG